MSHWGVDDELRELLAELKSGEEPRVSKALVEREGSRYVGPHADEAAVKHVAAGGTFDPSDVRVAPRYGAKSYGGSGSLARDLKALSESVNGSGGFTTMPQLAAEILRPLRARSAVMSMPGVRTVQVARELDLTSLSTGTAAAYTAENAAISYSEPTMAQSVLLKPRALTALTAISNRLIADAIVNPSIEEVLRSDLSEVIALRADLAFLRGTGVGVEPTGIRNQPGVNITTLGTGNGATPTFDDLKNMIATLRGLNAPFLNPGFIFHPRLLSTLEKMKDAQGRYLADAGLLEFDPTGTGGRLNGYVFRTSTQIPTTLTVGASSDASEVYFSSDWEEAWIGEEAGLRLEASSDASYTTDGGTTWISAFQNDQTLFRAITRHDIGLRRPSLFSVLLGVRP